MALTREFGSRDAFAGHAWSPRGCSFLLSLVLGLLVAGPAAEAQRPTKFDPVLDLKTAKVLGLTFPRSILIRADHLIE